MDPATIGGFIDTSLDTYIYTHTLYILLQKYSLQLFIIEEWY